MADSAIDLNNGGALHEKADILFSICSPTLESDLGITDSSPLPTFAQSSPLFEFCDMADYFLSLRDEAWHAITSDGQQRGNGDAQRVIDTQGAQLQPIFTESGHLTMETAGSGGVTAISLSDNRLPEGVVSGIPPLGYPASASLKGTSPQDTDESYEQVTTVSDADQSLTASPPCHVLASAEEDCATSSVPVEESSAPVGGGAQPASPSPYSSQANSTNGAKDVLTLLEVAKVADRNVGIMDISTPESIGANEKSINGAAVDSINGHESVQPADSTVDGIKAPHPLDGEKDEGRGAREASPSSDVTHGSSMNGTKDSPVPSAAVANDVANVDKVMPPGTIGEKEAGSLTVHCGNRKMSVEYVDLTRDGDDETPRPLDREQEAGKVYPSSEVFRGSSMEQTLDGSLVPAVVGRHPTESISANGKNVGSPTAGTSDKSRSVVFIDLTIDNSDDGDDEMPPPAWQCWSCNTRKRRSQFTPDGRGEKRRRTSSRKMAEGIRTNVRNPYLMKESNHPVSEYL